MRGLSFFFVLTSLVGVQQPIAFFDVVETNVAEIHLGDVADLKVLPPELINKAQSLVLVESPAWHKAQSFKQLFLASRARALLPALNSWLDGSFTKTTTVKRGTTSPTATVSPREGGLPYGKGDLVRVRLSVGAFTIERDAVAMQNGVAGEHFFVRTIDGDALSVFYSRSE
jgi:hypothetical protein